MSLSWIHQLLNLGLAFEPWCPRTYREDEAAREFRRARRQARKRKALLASFNRSAKEQGWGTVLREDAKPGSLILAAPASVRGIRHGSGRLVRGLPVLPRSLHEVWIRRWLELDYDSPREIPVVLDGDGGIYLAEPAAQLEYELQLAVGATELRLRVLETKPPACVVRADEAAPTRPKARIPGAA